VTSVLRFEAAAARPRTSTNLPSGLPELIGRDVLRRVVAELVQRHRLVTLVGSGGIGKTRLGLEVARNLASRYGDGVWLAELGLLNDQDLVGGAVAAALNLLPINGPVSGDRIAAAIGQRSLLLVLDNCEHLLDASARLADSLLRHCPGVSVLATSREPLGAEGECVFRVPPLDVPEDAPGPAAIPEALDTGAMRLFLVRVRASDPAFVADPHFVQVASSVCRELDGIPLAVELAGVRCAALGIDALAARLHDRFRVLAGAGRTALTRHQTLAATFEWSHDLLAPPQRIAFRRLAPFVGTFSLAAAVAVLADAQLPAADIPDHLRQLVAKSLLVPEASGAGVAYRLLVTTRAYAWEKLRESGELQQQAARHAACYRAALERAAPEFENRPPHAWREVSGRDIDNVRAALDWACGAAGDPETAQALTAAAVPLWMHLSLVNECRLRVQQALALAATGPPEPEREMRLHAALGSALLYTSMGPDARQAWNRSLELASALGNLDYQLRALWGLWVDRLNSGEFRAALSVSERFLALASASDDAGPRWIGERLVGVSFHFLGEQGAAAAHLQRMLNHYVRPANLSDVIRYHFDPCVTARCFYARARWLQGFHDEAARIVGACLDEARALGHALSLMNTLGQGACVVSFLAGDLAGAAEYAAMLEALAGQHGITLWQNWARCLQGAVRCRRGDLEEGTRLLRSVLPQHMPDRQLPRNMVLLGELALAHSAQGEHEAARRAIREALDRARSCEEGWYLAELMRIEAGVLLRQGAGRNLPQARSTLTDAVRLARSQEALALELRCAVDLCRLDLDIGRKSAARDLLASIVGRFTEGSASPDLAQANALLAGCT
jgi:predicted ATPase